MVLASAGTVPPAGSKELDFSFAVSAVVVDGTALKPGEATSALPAVQEPSQPQMAGGENVEPLLVARQ